MLFCSEDLSIDMERTGKQLEELMRERGYSIKCIQRTLHLSCPQPVYRWMRGQVLPSVDHLYVLAKILGVHMEELLVSRYGKVCEERCRMILDLWMRMRTYGCCYRRTETA